MVNYFITIIAKFSSIYDAIVVQFYNLLIGDIILADVA